MSYTVLARKYRPQTFTEVYAQDQIVTILQNAIKSGRIAHAYLFTGPRGVGKTSLARIYAKSLNCVHGPTITPCNKCENCLEITAGISSDVIEIDGASNTGVDDIRDLQKELMYSTSKSKYKIYIIDEVHMLSKSAFNALLKTLEEPPENVIFIFATTEPHKVLPTIISRCQRYDFKRIPVEAIVARLKELCAIEKIEVEEDALSVIAVKADGGMRDAMSLTDQVRSISSSKISLDEVLSVFGIVHFDVYINIFKAIASKNAGALVTTLHKIIENGYDIQEFINGLLDFNRQLLLLKLNIGLAEIPKKMLPELSTLVGSFTENDLLYISSYLIKTKTDLKTSDHQLQIAELAFIKLTKMTMLKNIDEIIKAVSQNPQSVVNNVVASTNVQTPEIQIPQQNFNIKPEATTESTTPVIEKTEEVQKLEPKPEGKKKLTPKTESIKKVSIEEIINKWEKFKGFALKKSTFKGGFIAKANPVSLSGVNLHLECFESAYDNILHNKEYFEELLAEFYKTKLVISCKKGRFESKKAEFSQKTIDFKDIEESDPNLAEFITLSDSVILQW